MNFDWKKLYELQNDNKINSALDLIFDSLCSFSEKPDTSYPDTSYIDIILAAVDPSKLTFSIMIGFLCAPYSISVRLKEYKPLLERIKIELKARGLPDDKIKNLLFGFDGSPKMRLILNDKN